MKRAIIFSFLMTILTLISNPLWSQSCQEHGHQNSRLKQTWDRIWRHNSRFTIPFEKFAADMKDERKRYQTYQWLRDQDPDFTATFDEFSMDILGGAEGQVQLNRTMWQEWQDHWQRRGFQLPGKKSLYYEADSLAKIEEFQRAISLYTIIIDTNEQCERAYFNRGSCKFQAGDHRGAIADLQTYLNSVKGIEHQPQSLTIYFVQLAHLIVGHCYSSLGNIEEGCRSYGKAGEYGSEEAYQYMNESCN